MSNEKDRSLQSGDVVTLQSDHDTEDNDRKMTVEIVNDHIACCVRLHDMESHPTREIFAVDALHLVQYEERESDEDDDE